MPEPRSARKRCTKPAAPRGSRTSMEPPPSKRYVPQANAPVDRTAPESGMPPSSPERNVAASANRGTATAMWSKTIRSVRPAPEYRPGRGEGLIDTRRRDVEVSDSPNGPRTEGAHAHAPGQHLLDGLPRVECAREIEEHEVRLDARGVELDARKRGQPFGEPAGVRLVVC